MRRFALKVSLAAFVVLLLVAQRGHADYQRRPPYGPTGYAYGASISPIASSPDGSYASLMCSPYSASVEENTWVLLRTPAGIKTVDRKLYNGSRSPLLSTAAWSERNLWAVFVSKGALVVHDPKTKKQLVSWPLGRFYKDEDGEIPTLLTADVAGFSGNSVLCRINYFNIRTWKTNSVYCLFDIKSHKVTRVTSALDFWTQPQNRPLATACLASPDVSIILNRPNLLRYNRSTLAAKTPVNSFDSVAYCRSKNLLYIAAITDLDFQTYFTISPALKGKLKPIAKSPRDVKMIVGPNGEILTLKQSHLQMVYPKKVDLGSATQASAGGSAKELVIWRWLEQERKVTCEGRDPKSGYALKRGSLLTYSLDSTK